MVSLDEVIKSLVASAPSLFASFATLIGVLYSTYKLHKGQEKAAQTAVEVKEAVKQETISYNDKLDTIHHLVNSALGAALRFAAITARRLAEVTKDEKDIGSAAAATKASDEHERQQHDTNVSDIMMGRPSIPLPKSTVGDGIHLPPSVEKNDEVKDI